MRPTGTVRIEFTHRVCRDDDDLVVEVVAEWDRDHGSGEVISITGPDGYSADLSAEEWDAVEAALSEEAFIWDDGAAEDAAEHRREMREWR